MVQIRGERRRAGDVDLDAGRRRHAVDDLVDGLHGFVGQQLALITGEIHLDGRGLAVVALRASRGERITPEVLHGQHVRLVRAQLADHGAVEPVRVVAEGLITLQHDHRGTVGFSFVEGVADAFHRHERRCVGRAQRHRPPLPDHFQGWHEQAEEDSDRHPEQDDRHREGVEHPGEEWPVGMGVGGVGELGAHADFTRQKV